MVWEVVLVSIDDKLISRFEERKKEPIVPLMQCSAKKHWKSIMKLI
jgi:hypothetical protein